MAEERLGASFSIDITALKTGLQQANRLIKESNSEFKAAAAGLGDWSKSEEGLTKKLKNLNDVAEIQEEKVNALQKEYDRLISEGLDPMSASAIKMRTDLNNQKADLAKTKAETEKYQKALEELGDSSDDAANDLEDLSNEAKDSGDGFTVAKGAVADFIGNGLSNLVSAAKNAISSLWNLAGETREFRQDMGTLNSAFDSAGFSAEQATGTWKDLYAVFGEDDRAVEAANNISRMSKNQEDLNEWVKITTGIWGTYQDALPVEGLAEAAGETAKTGKVTGVMADALNWSSEAAEMFADKIGEGETAEDGFNKALAECSNEGERQQLITDTLTALYGDAADQYEETAGSVMEANRAQAEQQQAMANLGETIEPVTTAVTKGFTEIINKVLELTDGIDFDAFSKKISSTFDAFIEKVLPKIIDGLQWIIDHKDGLIAGISGIGAAFAAFKVVSIIQSVTSALKGMSLAQAALNLVMSLNPIGLVVAAIAGLVAAFVVLWNKCDGFRNFWTNLWDNIKKVAASFSDWFQNTWKKITTWFSEVWTKIKNFAIDAWNGIKNVWNTVADWFNNNIITPIKTFFTNLWNNVVTNVTNAVNKVKEIWNTIIAFIQDKIVTPIKTKFTNLWNNVVTNVTNAVNKVKEIWNTIISFIQDKIVTPIKKKFTNLWDGVKTAAQNALENIKTAFNKLPKFFSGLWDKIKTTFSSLGTKIGSAISGAVKTAINSVLKLIESRINSAIGLINGAIGLINKLPGVSVGSVKTVSLPRLAEGGVVSRATTAVVGEDGAEAIVPLERNLEWIDKVADKVAEKMSAGGRQVVVNQTNNYSQAHSRYEIYKSKQQTAAAVRLALNGG